jgi:hypothetical protein
MMGTAAPAFHIRPATLARTTPLFRGVGGYVLIDMRYTASVTSLVTSPVTRGVTGVFAGTIRTLFFRASRTFLKYFV